MLDAGVCALPQLRFAQSALGCDAAALISGEALLPLNRLGARLLARQQRQLCQLSARGDFAPPFCGQGAGIDPAGPLEGLYIAHAAACFSADARKAPPVALCGDDPLAVALAEGAFARAGLVVRRAAGPGDMALSGGEIGLCLKDGGETCALADARGPLTDVQGQLLAAWTALEAGEEALLLPVHATRAIQALAQARGARVQYAAGEPALWMNALAERSPVQLRLGFDGIAGALSMLGALVRAGLSLDEWRASLPAVRRRSRGVSVPRARAGRALQALSRQERDAELGGGLRLRRGDAWAWIGPNERGPGLRVIAEAPTDETARELCDFCARELTRLAGSE